MKKFIDFLAGIAMTAVSGIFLLASLIFPRLGVSLPIDPAWGAVAISGLPLFYSAIRKLIHNRGISKISSALLISIAMTAAVAIGDLFAAGEVAFIMALGEILEDITTGRAKRGLKKLISLAPITARRMIDGREETVSVQEIEAGNVLRILPGETVPADGVIISGNTSVDQSVMTGESLPVDKAPGDEIYCGTVNCFGSVDIRATRVGDDSSLKKLIRMVKEAEEKKAPTARIADKWASILVPVALLIAVITGIVTKDITAAVTVLVVFCPCALVLATPTAIMAAIGQATKHGVIIKSGEALEKMGKVDTVAFDKTGTLSCGSPVVCDLISFHSEVGEDSLLSLTASAEAKSEHPLARAIVAYAKEKAVEITDAEQFSMEAGKGICAVVASRKIICGSESYLADNGISLSQSAEEKVTELRNAGKAPVLVADESSLLGAVALSDVLRPEAAETVKRLEALKVSSVLLTGDSKAAAEYFASRAGIKNVKAELLPEEKLQSIGAMQAENKTVCMIGDGVNDAPALKSADVGVAMGSMGSDIAVEAADVALMSDDLSKIPYLKSLSIATVRTIKAGITLSMIINAVAVTLSVAKVLNPTTGALVHNVGSLLVVLIAALLYDRKIK